LYCVNTVKPAHVVTYIKRSPFSCPDIENGIKRLPLGQRKCDLLRQVTS
jgi:hypothetical protein